MKLSKTEQKELFLALDMMELVLSHPFLAQNHQPQLNCLLALAKKRHKKHGHRKSCDE